MERKWVLAVLVLCVLASPAAADEQPQSPLPIRVYNNVGLPAEDLRTATLGAELILGRAGIAVAWIECWNRDAEPAMGAEICRRPAEADALTLRLPSSSSVRPAKVVSMGYSLVRLEDRAPFLATVYMDVVTSVALDANIDVLALLGRAIAHEIGHLLLNTTRHANGGLMREKWTQDELRRNDAADWEFREQDIAIMQAAVWARLAQSRHSAARLP
jgi:hypothetical protein